jgi:phenylalanyl-tRNA synthetase alpha chain
MSNPNSIAKTLKEIASTAEEDIASIKATDKLEEWRISYLGRKGKLTSILRSLGALSQEERHSIGKQANSVKTQLENLFTLSKTEIMKNEHLQKGQDYIDVTLPGKPLNIGRLHPITQVTKEINSTFSSMGFQVIEGPEVEWDKYNFEMLNIPKDHPARDMFDTLWIDYLDHTGKQSMLLRTHTSPMQARTMERMSPPIRVVVPGKVYRYEATDSTHEWHFSQVEGLAVDKGITFADLKGTLFEFARRIFGPNRKVQFRCDYFPFVEPGVDMSIDCFKCNGKGCRICKKTGWIEVMGAGMVHPKVLTGVNYDPKKYSGFAFGIGLERIAMLKYGIEDIRLFYNNDLRFLEQF